VGKSYIAGITEFYSLSVSVGSTFSATISTICLHIFLFMFIFVTVFDDCLNVYNNGIPLQTESTNNACIKPSRNRIQTL